MTLTTVQGKRVVVVGVVGVVLLSALFYAAADAVCKKQ